MIFRNFYILVMWSVTWSKLYVKAKGDVNINIPGKFHAVLCDLVEDIIDQSFFPPRVWTQALSCLRMMTMTLRSKTFLKNSSFLIQPAICQNIRSNYINSNLKLCLLPQPLFRFCSIVSFEKFSEFSNIIRCHGNRSGATLMFSRV